MGETAESYNHYNSSHYFSKISLLCVAAVILVPSAISIHFGFSHFLVTVSILCLSTIFLLKISRRKSNSAKKPPANQQAEQEVSPEMEAAAFCDAAQQSEVSDCPSGSESSDDFSASEGFELNWACLNNLGKNVAISEILDSSDDEDEDDNLIEISFPEIGSSVELNEVTGAKMQMELPESMFRQEGFMELMKEINEVTEEENLIEIDISMGSIKEQYF